MGEVVANSQPISEENILKTNSAVLQDKKEADFKNSFTFEDIHRLLILFCDKYSLDKAQVLLGVFFTVLLVFFSIATVVAWKTYSPIIQEFIVKESIEKARAKHAEKQKRRMNSFKKFFSKKKVNRHFKNSGGGVRLDSGEGSSQPSITTGSAQRGTVDRVAAADIAAQAALKRMYKNEPQQDASKKRIQMLAKREIEAKRKQLEGLSITEEERPTTDVREFEHSSAITRVLFTSELLGEDIAKPKSELLEDLKHFLIEQVDCGDDDSDKMIAAVLMIYSLNKTAVRDLAVETISKYLQNILTNPGEEKYKSIRLSNKAFQERVDAAIGGRKFLESVGFVEETRGEDTFLYFSSESDTHLVDALESLRNGQSVPIKVARNLEIFHIEEGQKIQTPKLGDEFFNLSAEEVKKEQKSREAQVERMLTLRTKEMRMKDEQLRNYRYKYTLIRVRMPGNLLVQGVFGCYEAFSTVRTFVASVLSDSAVCSEFSLRDASGQRVDDESITLAQLGLAPAAILHLDFSEMPEVVLADNYAEIVKTFEN